LSEKAASALHGPMSKPLASKPLIDPFDPVALAARIAEARALRAVALSKKQQDGDQIYNVLKRGRLEPRAQSPAAIASPRSSAAMSMDLRAEPAMRLARGPALYTERAPAAAGLHRPKSHALRPNGDAAPIMGLVAGCIICGTAVLALHTALFQQTADLNPRRPEVVFQPMDAQGAAPLPSTPPHIESSIEPGSRISTVPLPLDRYASSPGFVPASGQITIASNQLIQEPPIVPRPAVDTAPQALIAPLLLQPDGDPAALLEPPQVPVASRAPLQTETIQVAALPSISLPRTFEPVGPADPRSETPEGTEDAAARAESTLPGQGRSPTSALYYRIGVENLRTPPWMVGTPVPVGSRVTDFRLAVLSDFGVPIVGGPIDLLLKTGISPAEPAAARARVAPSFQAATGARLDQVAPLRAPEQSILERKVQRLLRQQLRELRRR
jgi:hypothetical protein